MAEEKVIEEKKDNKVLIYILVAVAAVVLVGALIVIAAVAIFFYIGFTGGQSGVGPGHVEPTMCAFPPGISCSNFALHSDGSLDLMIGQATGHRMNVTGVACSQGYGPPATWAEKSVGIGNGEQASLGNALCTTAVGLPATGVAGETARFRIWINYTETDTGMQRQFVGDMTARYEP